MFRFENKEINFWLHIIIWKPAQNETLDCLNRLEKISIIWLNFDFNPLKSDLCL